MLRTLLPTLVGIVIIVVVMRDAVHELFHPEASGSMSEFVMSGVWAAVRRISRWHHDFIYRAGPIILLSVMATWVILLVVGFALIYWPRLPAGFNPNPALPLERAQGFGTALYVSLASFTTVSASDLTPKSETMRMLVATESLVGPVIFTAWITWVLSIYPVLAARRTFTREIDSMRKAWPDPKTVTADVPKEAVTDLLRSLTEQGRQVDAQFQQTRVSYYFQNKSSEAALAVQLPYVLLLGRAAARADGPSAVRHYGTMLTTTIEDLISSLGAEFLKMRHAPPERVIRALAEDHLLDDPFEKLP